MASPYKNELGVLGEKFPPDLLSYGKSTHSVKIKLLKKSKKINQDLVPF